MLYCDFFLNVGVILSFESFGKERTSEKRCQCSLTAFFFAVNEHSALGLLQSEPEHA